MCSPGRCLQGLSQGTCAVIDVAFSPGMFIRETSGSFPVDPKSSLYFSCFALDFQCALQRLLCGHAEFVMNCSAVADFPESVTQQNARGFMCSPAISEVLGCRCECVAVDASAFGRHGDSFGTEDVLVTPPASQSLAQTVLGTLKPLPVTMKTVSKDIKDFAEGEIPGSVSASHRSDSCLGCMSKSNNSSIVSFTMQINSSLLSLNSQ